MKKISVFILLLLLLSGCTLNCNSQTSVRILGEYFCTNPEFDTEYFIEHPELIPNIAFYDNNKCKIHINYLEGVADILGSYEVHKNIITVILLLENSPFYNSQTGEKFIDEHYTLTIIDDNQIVPDKDFYAYGKGDIFRRKA